MRLNYILDAQFEEVWQMLHTPIELLQDKSIDQVFDDQKN
jgi:hypothetical protein